MKTITQKLEKTINSINNHIARNGFSVESQRSHDLMFRYSELKEQAIEEGTWEAYCSERGFHPSHNAGDCFA